LSLLTLLRVIALAFNATDLFVDEAQYWAWSSELAAGYYSKPPLVAWILAGAREVCGESEFCVRLPSPLIHAATSILIYLIARRLYSAEAGFWSALVFATLPGISLSSGIISTDVPLLFAWALALLALIELTQRPQLLWAIVLGAAIGLGLNAKYAMAYFIPSAAIFFLIAPEKAALLRRPHPWIAVALGLALIAPNIAWNAANAFATFAHTADNTGWAGSLFHPGKAAEFFLAQFGVFGPILFGALLVIVWRARTSLAAFTIEDRLLLAFSVPLILVVTCQAFLSHAFANWAAPAYVAATVLVIATMIRDRAWSWLKGSLALHLVVAVAIPIAASQAGSFKVPGAGDPFARTLGNRELAVAVRKAVADGEADGRPFATIIADERETVAALLYYAPELAPGVRAWRRAGRPRDHFELKRSFTSSDAGPALLVTRQASPAAILEAFGAARPLGAREIDAGRFTTRTIHLFALSEYRAR
jgi:4-amino-4-deoxy-L-arabinose transferase-like glycosyltransferase